MVFFHHQHIDYSYFGGFRTLQISPNSETSYFSPNFSSFFSQCSKADFGTVHPNSNL